MLKHSAGLLIVQLSPVQMGAPSTCCSKQPQHSYWYSTVIGTHDFMQSGFLDLRSFRKMPLPCRATRVGPCKHSITALSTQPKGQL